MDVDFIRKALLVPQGKGQKDRVTRLPDEVTGALGAHLHHRPGAGARSLFRVVRIPGIVIAGIGIVITDSGAS